MVMVIQKTLGSLSAHSGKMQHCVERSSLTHDISPAHDETKRRNYSFDFDEARIGIKYLWTNPNQRTDRGDGRIRSSYPGGAAIPFPARLQLLPGHLAPSTA